VGIAGSDRFTQGANYGTGAFGPVSYGGILIPGALTGSGTWGRGIEMREILDGTSTSLVVGEQSDWGVDVVTNTKSDIRTSRFRSGWFGVRCSGSSSRNNWPGCNDARMGGVTTVRFALNFKDTTIGNPMSAFNSTTLPIQSAHPGGVNLAFADGHVQFVYEAINITTFKDMCDRIDGNTVTLP
jgi:prepilin-type processing-associated H-X9-DG protein